jgi:tyrosyl-tRNA synthetase
MLLQAYDFAELNRRYACRLQIGGSDQWGNIVNGIELNRKLAQAEVYGLTTPLLTTSSGTKMGKTASGAVWLSADMLSPYDYFQFWRNTDDADVIPFLRLFTDISIEEIEELSKLDGSGINEAKKILAYAATKLCHGGKEADASLETARVTFEEKNLGKRLPVTEISKAELEVGVTIAELLQRCKLSASGGEAKRLIRGKGARVNDNVVDNERTIITIEDAIDGNIKLSAGKKNHAVIKVG